MTLNTTSSVWLLERAAEKFGEDIAFKDAYGQISFKDLREKSRSVASQLIKKADTGRLRPIMVYLPKSINSIISFMGAMYSGSPYVPMDYNVPVARFAATAENLNPAAVITDKDGRERLTSAGIDVNILLFDEITDGEKDNNRIEQILKNSTDLDPAYIMYTSGNRNTEGCYDFAPCGS